MGLGGAQLKSHALSSAGRFCRSTAALVWPKGAEPPGSAPAAGAEAEEEDEEEDRMHIADAVAQGIIRALAVRPVAPCARVLFDTPFATTAPLFPCRQHQPARSADPTMIFRPFRPSA